MITPLLGTLSDRLGRMKMILPATLLFGAASVVTGLVESFEWGLASRVLTGLASAGMLSIAFAMAALAMLLFGSAIALLCPVKPAM
jgi:MFS family permease